MLSYLVPLAIFAGILLFAYLAGAYVKSTIRGETGRRVSFIVAVLCFAIWIIVAKWPPKQGIDLKGGVILIYEVDQTLTRQTARRAQTSDDGTSSVTDADLGAVDMPGLVQGLSRRINPGGLHEIVVRPYGANQVEIIIPDVSGPEVDEIKRLITTGGFLKFQIVANRRDHSHVWALADEPDQVGQYEVRDAAGNVVGQWVKLEPNPQAREGESPYREDPPQAKSRMVRGHKEVLMYVDPNFDLQGGHLTNIRKGYQGVTPAVFFDTTISGARLMGGLTASNLPDTTSGHYALLGVVMDGELKSAPRINSTITTSGLIEGNFSDEEVEFLVNVLRAGRLPAVLHKEPISQNQISPLLGTDTIRQGRVAILVSLVCVLGFMLIYYRFAGVIASIALLMNLTFILALMMFVGAAFSLPGMAALVLTVGMSVDANVLIYERIREELRSGAALRMAIRNGFQRATRAIVDSNLTSLITAFVLYGIGTEQLRAFAITLILGILMTLFTGVFCSRVFFELAEKSGVLKRLSMIQMPDTNWDLFNMRYPASIFALIVIAIGMAATFARGSKIFDIDFLGGTSVQLLLNEPMPIADVRERVENLRRRGIADDVSVTEVQSEVLGSNRIYRIDTSLPSLDTQTASAVEVQSAIAQVQQALIEEFRDEQGESLLTTRTVRFTTPAAIDTAPAAALVEPAAPALPDIDDLLNPEPPDESTVDPAGADAASPDADTSQPESGADDEAIHNDAALDAESLDQPSDAAESPEDNQGASARRYRDRRLTDASETLFVQARLPEAADSTATTPPATDTSDPFGATAATSDSSRLRSRSTLTFEENIGPGILEAMIKDAARSLGLVEPDVLLTSEEPNWEEGSSKGHQVWQVQLSSPPEQAARILSTLQSQVDGTPVWLSANEIGSSVAGDKTRLAIAAVIGSILGIIIYIWFRFHHVAYGVAAVVALIHDVLVTVGALAASYWLKDIFGFLMIDEFKISLPVMAALLTIIGYSLNDTIVIFDRIRELKGKSPHITVDIINASINQTLSRTILTAFTTLIAAGILYFLGGQGIHAFAYAMVIGVIAGTYSTIFIASPVLLWLTTRNVQAKQAVPEKITA